MKLDIITLFPGMFVGPLDESIVGRARERGLLTLAICDLRDHTSDKHRTADDYPYGGGPGMVMKPEPIFAAVEALRCPPGGCSREEVILLSPQGELFNQTMAEDLARAGHLLLICGHYEGVDARVEEHLATRRVSIGDYVLSGGELPAMVLVEAVTRLLPGAIGAETGAQEESFAGGLLEYPQYTRPAEFRGWRAPEVLLSGNHEEIRRWRRREALRRTLLLRPDLLERAELTREDRELLEEIEEEAGGEGIHHGGTEDTKKGL